MNKKTVRGQFDFLILLQTMANKWIFIEVSSIS